MFQVRLILEENKANPHILDLNLTPPTPLPVICSRCA